MSVSSPKAHPASGRGSKRRLYRILLVAVAILLVYSAIRMITYNPNYVVAAGGANRLKLKSGDGVLLIGLECPPQEETQVGEPGLRLTEKLVLNRYVRIETDVETMDPSGWIRGYVFAPSDGQEVFLNEELLRKGLARLKLMFPNLKYRDRLQAAEAEAKSRKVGLWSPDYKPPGS